MMIVTITRLLAVLFATFSAATYQTENRCMNYHRNCSGKIAVGFAGIARGIDYVLPSVERHVFGALQQHDFEYDVFVSTLTNPTFFGHKVDEFEIIKLRPCYISMISQALTRRKEFDRMCKARNYPCENGVIKSTPTTNLTKLDRRLYCRQTRKLVELKNYMLAFEAQERLASMIREKSLQQGFQYDAVVMLRPDVAFIRDIDLHMHFKDIVDDHTIWFPDFQTSYGYNDRAAFGSQGVMLKYLERGEHWRKHSSYNVTIAETFLWGFVRDTNLTVKQSGIRFIRVRPMEDKGNDVGIIADFDIQPHLMGLGGDESDLKRCIHPTMHVHQTGFKYKAINANAC